MTTMLSDTTLALICAAALAPLIGIAAADAIRDVFPLRSDLLSPLALVRLQEMLRRRGIGVETYLRMTSRRQIAAQIRTCETCPSKPKCDAVLRSSECSDHAFCPSNPDLTALRQQLGLSGRDG
ncbi:MAG: hypothetical protein P4L83_13960 [Nevskia sp.]|nr:hypothetical protein [Nevskia sp.]